MTKEDKPHKAIINVQIEVHDILDTGECSGRIVDLSQYDIQPFFLLSVDGENLNDCLQNLKTRLDCLKGR